jgi:hypothetical protein
MDDDLIQDDEEQPNTATVNGIMQIHKALLNNINAK